VFFIGLSCLLAQGMNWEAIRAVTPPIVPEVKSDVGSFCVIVSQLDKNKFLTYVRKFLQTFRTLITLKKLPRMSSAKFRSPLPKALRTTCRFSVTPSSDTKTSALALPTWAAYSVRILH
jgi:hypothetical protein